MSVHDKLKQKICIPTKAHLWTKDDEIEFTPAIPEKIFGDGRALFGLTTCNSRPAFYIIRGDSSWFIDDDYNEPDNAPHLIDQLETIYETLEEEFGIAAADEEETDPQVIENGHPFPAFDYGGGSMWWRVKWPEGFDTEDHPYNKRYNLLIKEPQQ